MNTITHTTKGSIFDDLGFTSEQAENLKIRAQLMQELSQIIENSYHTQTEAAKSLGITQSRISDLKRGKIQKFTIDNLINIMSKSGYRVEFCTKKAA